MSDWSVKKLGYSVNPWRILWQDQEVGYLSYRLKRDAVAALAKIADIDLDMIEFADEATKARIVEANQNSDGGKTIRAALQTAYAKMNQALL